MRQLDSSTFVRAMNIISAYLVDISTGFLSKGYNIFNRQCYSYKVSITRGQNGTVSPILPILNKLHRLWE
jgi:hypothetical protein